MNHNNENPRKRKGMRRSVVTLIAALLALTLIPVVAWASHRFSDVPDSNVFHEDIGWLAESGVTLGCNPPENTEYCPKDDVTREQMAAFLRRLAVNQVVDSATVGGLTVDQIIEAASGAESVSDLYWFSDPATPAGHSTLVRTSDVVKMTFQPDALAPQHAYTIWWVIFNQPENCSDPGCGEDDIFIDGDPTKGLNEDQIAAADIVAGYATGKVASTDGSARFVAALSEGQTGQEVLFGSGALLKDATGAEVHLVNRSHGPVIPGKRAEQIGSFAGGCEVFLNPPEVPDAEGECADVQFAVHQP